MRKSRIVLALSCLLAAALWFVGFNNVAFNRETIESFQITEQMIIKQDGLYYFDIEDTDYMIKVPQYLLDEIVFGNMYNVHYSYNKWTKKGNVLKITIT